MGACKNLNLILPYATYQELKRISIRQDKPISEIVREGIRIVLDVELKPKDRNGYG